MVPSRRGPGTVLVLLLFDIGLCLNEKGKSSFGKENFDADGTMAGDEVSIIKVNQKGDVEKYLFDGDILPAG
nr:unnamed protein product [Haemonchus contortus]